MCRRRRSGREEVARAGRFWSFGVGSDGAAEVSEAVPGRQANRDPRRRGPLQSRQTGAGPPLPTQSRVWSRERTGDERKTPETHTNTSTKNLIEVTCVTLPNLVNSLGRGLKSALDRSRSLQCTYSCDQVGPRAEREGLLLETLPFGN